MQRLALSCVLVPAGAVLSGTPVTSPTIRNAVASILRPGNSDPRSLLPTQTAI